MAEADDLRQFIRETTLRFERAMRALSAEIRDEVRQAREESRRYFEIENAKLDELLADNRAQRQALLHILDRLSNGGAAAG